MVCSKSSSKWEVYSDTGLPQEKRKISNKQPNLPSKGIRKKEQTKPKFSLMKEIIKKRENISKIETKENNRNDQ